MDRERMKGLMDFMILEGFKVVYERAASTSARVESLNFTT
jgi:hypothetical protein